MSHVLEVLAVATRLADILGLNVNLVRAIAMGHDIGHVPFGHQGEDWLSKKMGRKFTHEVMGVVVAQHIERQCRGLNLTFATLDGMMRHSGKNVSQTMTPEAWVVRYADKIAYLFADYNDLKRLRAEVIMPPGLREVVEWFGEKQRERVAVVEAALVEESARKGRVSFDDSEEARKFVELYKLMNSVYPKVTQQNVDQMLGPIWEELERMSIGNPGLLIALMTDKEIAHLRNYRSLNMSHFSDLGMMEIVPFLREKEIDMCAPDLDW
jgi:dGTP triphosphohydrolase